jgi:hypothetical protein
MEEIWKPIKDFENYEVSTLGNIRNKVGHILTQRNKGGYMYVSLCNKDKGKTKAVHRLVALTFIDNSENKLQVNHIDKNLLNNNYTNLEWCNSGDNNVYEKSNTKKFRNTSIQVWRIDNNTNKKLELYNSLEDAASWCVTNNYTILNKTASIAISDVINDKCKTAYDFKWIIKEQTDLENEEWRNININGIINKNYFVSNMGRFKNNKGIIMENYKPNRNGYIHITINGQKHLLHRLIAMTFLDNLKNFTIVNHIDGNKTNNNINNLEWCTMKESCIKNNQTGFIKYSANN